MNHDITYYAKNRHTTKAYDASQRIPEGDIEKLKELLRYSPSSVNGQPWHFVIASTETGKSRVAKATQTAYPFNTQAILDASHVIVFASKLAIEEDYLLKVLAQEEKDGRFASDPDTFKPQMHEGRTMFVNIHKQDFKDVQHWMDKQVYLNLGGILLGAATLGIDATPMEGVDTKVLDDEFDLRSQGYSSLFVVALGYSYSEHDFNANIPKSRLPYSEILTEV